MTKTSRRTVRCPLRYRPFPIGFGFEPLYTTSCFRDTARRHIGVTSMTFQCHMTSSVTIRLAIGHVLFAFLWNQASISNGFYPRDATLARVIVIATCLSVCPSVCPSVTRRYCVKTKKASGMISSASDSPKTLVFRRQTSSPNSKAFPPNGSLKQGSVGKIQRFLPARRYASAGNSDRNVSVCPSVRHAPVLCQNEES